MALCMASSGRHHRRRPSQRRTLRNKLQRSETAVKYVVFLLGSIVCLGWMLTISSMQLFFEPTSSSSLAASSAALRITAGAGRAMMTVRDEDSGNNNNSNKIITPVIVIPHRLIFTHKTNILENANPFDPIYLNIQNTIKVYREAWERNETGSDGRRKTDASINRATTAVDDVWFLDDDACRTSILQIRPHSLLIHYFDLEKRGSFKSDICRLAALYQRGGYYIDTDMRAVTAVRLVDDDDSSNNNNNNEYRNNRYSMITVEMENGAFFQSFLASAPRNPLIYRALLRVEQVYEEWDGLWETITAATSAISNNNNNEDTDNSEQVRIQKLKDYESQLGVAAGYLTVHEKDRPSSFTRRLWEAYMRYQFKGRTNLLGPGTLHQAYDANETTDVERQSVWLLKESNLEDSNQQHHATLFPNVPLQVGRGCCCNYIVHAGVRNRTGISQSREQQQLLLPYFFSRMVGASDRCMPPLNSLRVGSVTIRDTTPKIKLGTNAALVT